MNLEEKIIKTLKDSPTTLSTLKDIVKSKKLNTKKYLTELKEKGYPIKKQGKYYYLDTNEFTNYKTVTLPQHSLIGVISDTHYGSKYCKEHAIKDFYDELKKEGAMYVLHAGDLIQGVNIYPTEQADLKYFTLEDQLNNFIDKYPDDLQTYFIQGNHDRKLFEKGKSPNIAKIIDNYRKDLTWLGDYYGRLKGKRNDIKIDLLHSSKGVAYAKSYHPQRYIEQMKDNNKPDILIWGHQHDSMYMYYNGVHLLKAGTFQDENPYTLRKGLNTTVGGWLVELNHDGEKIRKFKPMFISYS